MYPGSVDPPALRRVSGALGDQERDQQAIGGAGDDRPCVAGHTAVEAEPDALTGLEMVRSALTRPRNRVHSCP